MARPLSISSEKLWRLGGVPEDWKKADVDSIYKKALKEDPGSDRPIGLVQSLGKLWNKGSWETSEVK